MTDFKTNKLGQEFSEANLIPNLILNDLSYTYKEPKLKPQSIQEVSISREITSPRSNNLKRPKEPLSDASEDKSIVYPSPQPSYNPNQSPPDLAKAIRHGLTHKVQNFQACNWFGEVCESTGLPIIFRNIKLCCSMTDIYFLGPVISMYFVLVKQVTFATFLLSLVPIAMTIALYSGSWTDYNSIVTTLFENEFIMCACSFGALFVLFFLVYLFRRSQKATKMACKKSVITTADYTVMASNLEANYPEEELRIFFTHYIIPKYSLDLCKITPTFDIEEYTARVRKIHELHQAKLKAEKEVKNVSSGVVAEIQKKIDIKEQFFLHLENQYPAGLIMNRNGLCFATFNTKQEAKTVRRKFEFSLLERSIIWVLEKMTGDFPEYFFKGKFVYVEKAPELREIIWENLGYSSSRKAMAILNSVFLLSVFVVNFIAIMLIKKSFSSPAYLMGLFIALFNEIIAFLISVVMCHERFRTITEFYIAYEKRTSFFQFLNTALPIFILDNVSMSFANTSSVSLPDFAVDVLIISAISSLLPVVLRLINLSYLKKIIMRKRVKYQIGSTREECKLTQSEANHVYEDPEFEVHKLNADIIKTFLVSCFFLNMSPGVVIIAFISYFLTYFVEKYNLLRKSLQPTSLRSEVSEEIFEFLELGIFLLAVGNNVFVNLNPVDDSLSTSLSIGGIGVAFFYLILPNKRIARNLFPIKKKVEWTNILFYQQASEYFSDDYHISNPGSKLLKSPFQRLQKVFRTDYKPPHSSNLRDLFDYAVNRPTLSEVVMNGLNGLRNPFYIFPQNYGYGALYLGLAPMMTKENTPIKTPLMDAGITGLKSPSSAKGKRVARISEMVPPSSSSIETREKLGLGEFSAKPDSIMKDIQMLPSFSGKSNYGFKMSSLYNQKDNFLHSFPDVNDSKNNINSSSSHLGYREKQNQNYGPQSNSGFLDGISPITEGLLGLNNSKK